ncbi:MAG: SCP2 sterol-binding domain-containing protein [Pseudomonadota bacterium]
MSVMEQAVGALNEKMDGDGFDAGTAKFEVEGMGSIIIDSNGARVGDEDADVTLKADAETLQGIMTGDVNPTTAFMTGKLSVDGDMGLAMKLAGVLS